MIVNGLEVKKFFTFGAQYGNFYILVKSIYDKFSYRNLNFQFIPKLSRNYFLIFFLIGQGKLVINVHKDHKIEMKFQ